MLDGSAGGQRGQALVGVMVVMIILFALAGAVAIGASTLLNQRNVKAPASDDFRVRSALNGTVADLAGSTQTCVAPPPPSPAPAPSPWPTATPLNVALPSPDAAVQSRCMRQDGVDPSSVRSVQVNGSAVYDLQVSPAARVAVLFDVRSAAGWAYVDNQSTQSSQLCGSAIPPATPRWPCSAKFSTSAVTQVALTCDVAQGDTAYLHLKVAPQAVGRVFAARQDPADPSSDGSLYLLAIQSPVANPDYEEAVLFVSNDGQTNRLVYEAPLP